MGTFTKEFWLDFPEEGEQNKNDLIKTKKKLALNLNQLIKPSKGHLS